MIRTIYLISLLVILPGILRGQNKLDAEGRRTGRWEVEYPNGRTRYTGKFEKGRPVGEMVHYYEDGGVRARMQFDSSGHRSYTKLYYNSGKLAAEGWFDNQQKDSVWTYYSEFDGLVRFREPYHEGKLHGEVKRYYQHGIVSESVQWETDRKEGTWKQYYPDGALRLEGVYAEDQLNGPYRVYYADSTLKIKGNYTDGLSEGTWSYYDPAGERIYSIEFEDGKALDRDRYLELMQDSLTRFEEIAEPDTRDRPNF